MTNPAKDIDVSKIAEECIKAIRAALKQFGEYSYYDKGATEVMDLAPFIRRFKAMDGRTVGEILQAVLAFEHGQPFCSDIVSALDGWPEEKFEAMLAVSDEVANLY